MASGYSSTGYGPAKHLMFNGEDTDYEVWEMRFSSYLRLQKLHKYVMNPDDSLKTEPDTQQEGSNTTAVLAEDGEKNAEVFASLVQFLDDKSVNLIIRDARNDGRKALKILRDHFKRIK